MQSSSQGCQAYRFNSYCAAPKMWQWANRRLGGGSASVHSGFVHVCENAEHAPTLKSLIFKKL